MKKFFSILVIIIALTIAGIVGYGAYNYVQEKNSLKFTPIPSPDIDLNQASSTPDIATSTVDISEWKIYDNQELGYSIKYPKDLIVNYDALSLILAFPKDKYFHWPLLDDVKLTLISTSTCSSDIASSSQITVNGIKYRFSKSDGAAMGTVYKENVYEINGNSVCYTITYNSKGTNGAGFYVDDPSLIKKYDNQHSLDNDEVIKIIYGILGSFKINTIEPGKVES
jgi:hypothetical protein